MMKGKAFTLLEVLIGRQRSWRVSKTRGFTLLEVLIAGGILFIVSAAVVGLNNSIIQGTAVNADVTILNRWSSEGLELVTASRDNNLLSANTDGSNQVWLNQASATNQYGWYVLSQPNGGSNWTLSAASGLGTTIGFSAVTSADSEVKTSQSLTAYRLICIEAVGAVDSHTDTQVSCNSAGGVNGSTIVSDGDRSSTSYPCSAGDNYCANSVASLNRNQLAGAPNTIIPAGNAVKVRAVVITQSKANYTISDVATILTNWKGFEQL